MEVKRDKIKSALFRVSELLDKSYLSPKQEIELDHLILEIDDHLMDSDHEDIHLTKLVTRFKKQRLTF